MAFDRGSGHYNTELTEDDIRLIRALCVEADMLREQLKGLSLRAIGEKFGLHPQSVYEIKHRRTWGHVD